MPSTNRINHTIVIQRTAIHLLLAERSVQAPAVAILQLSPRPRVVIEFELKSDESEASNEMRCQQVIQIRLDQGPTIDVLVGDNWHLGGGKISNILIPIEQPITVFNDNTKINKCKFSLINFPSIWGKQDIKYTKEINGKPHNVVTQYLKLRAHPWSTKITAVDSRMSLDYKLKREGGSAITHFGSVTQSNGQDFSQKNSSSFLRHCTCSCLLLVAPIAAWRYYRHKIRTVNEFGNNGAPTKRSHGNETWQHGFVGFKVKCYLQSLKASGNDLTNKYFMTLYQRPFTGI